MMLGAEVHLFLICFCMKSKAFTRTFTQVLKYEKLKEQIIVGSK